MKHRYLLETAESEYDVDDYLIRQFGVECFRIDEEGPDNFIIYEPITAIHDFAPKLATLEAFQTMKQEILQKAHEDWQKAEEEQRASLNRVPPSDVDCV